jgi:hypothetical protein
MCNHCGGFVMGSSQAPAMLTLGTIAERLGVFFHRVRYILASRNIPAKGWAGNCRVYDEDVVPVIAQELEALNNKRGGR